MTAARHGLRRWGGDPVVVWRTVVHHCIHPVSGGIVLTAARIELFEWLYTAAEHLRHLMEAAAGTAAG